MNEDQITQEIDKIITVGVKNGDQKYYEMTYDGEVHVCRKSGSKWGTSGELFKGLKQIKRAIVLGELKDTEIEPQPKIDPEHGDLFDCIDANALLIHILKYGSSDILGEIENTVIANARTKFEDGVEVIDYDWAANQIDQYRKRQENRLGVNSV